MKKVALFLIFTILFTVTLTQAVDAGNKNGSNNSKPTSPKEIHTSKPKGKPCDQLYTLVKDSFGSTCTSTPSGKEPYNPVADINKDGQINITDFSLLSSNYSNQSWCQQKLKNTLNPCSLPTSPVLTLNGQSKSNLSGYSRFFNSN